MSHESFKVVRQPIAVKPRPRRRMVERLGLRLPWVASLIARMVLRRPPHSRIRKAMIGLSLRMAIEAANRYDYEAAFMLLNSPDYEVITPPELVGLGFDPVYRGSDGRLRFQQLWVAELGEFQQETQEVIDCGDRLLLLGRMEGSGLGSGATFDSEIAYLLWVSEGQIVREQDFRSHEEALEAAGLQQR